MDELARNDDFISEPAFNAARFGRGSAAGKRDQNASRQDGPREETEGE
jgi:hypothetical protein